MGIVTITLATAAGLASMIFALFWQTPVAIALAMMITWGALLTGAATWYFAPNYPGIIAKTPDLGEYNNKKRA